ncbi:MAG: aminotransferase class I/II-fold pyridoxal phosphate-dependent enzyme [Clostridia bacterium]|nr:aminotransferase class I/II-fold pyridoxal phosphate-dependent enzyme [Clostridia bacterium]
MLIKPFENRIFLSSPTMHGDELVYIKKAYETNWVSTVGENIDEIEKQIAEKTGCKYAVALSSGTCAIHMCLKAAGVRKNDIVFVSDMTFNATVNPIIYEGATPVFIDCEYESWNMDYKALEKAFEIYPDTKVVLCANLYSTSADYDKISEVCQKHSAILIEDAAETLGAKFKNKQTGSFGKYNAISFNGNKIITGSSGGMFLTDSYEDACKVMKWSTQSQEDTAWYQNEEIGYNYRMSNVVAGVVRGQLPYLEEHIAKKKKIYERYKQGFKRLPLKMNPYYEKTSEPNFWLSCIIINKEAMCRQTRNEREAFYEKEAGKTCPTEIYEKLEKYNVESRPLWKPMHLQPLFKDNDFVTADGLYDSDCRTKITDVGSDLFDRGLCLPSDIKMTEEEQDIIIEIIKSCFE